MVGRCHLTFKLRPRRPPLVLFPSVIFPVLFLFSFSCPTLRQILFIILICNYRSGNIIRENYDLSYMSSFLFHLFYLFYFVQKIFSNFSMCLFFFFFSFFIAGYIFSWVVENKYISREESHFLFSF